ncbi:MAG: agmatine deiminase family protein [Pseudomonadales bacterium]|jgi:agmatine deiminase|nr:agmatine deiminase family protein [Pseudomonadales bacterium]
MKAGEGMIAEWAEVEAVLLAWPHQSTDWQPWLVQIQQDYVALATAIATSATPLILCQDAAHEAQIRAQLGQRCHHAPRFVQAPYNDTWCRDYGPVAVRRDGRLTLLDFQFRGWGDKYDAVLDNGINQQLQDLWLAPLETVNYELEGGSIETDGQGSLLTTAHCLLDSNRNQAYDKPAVEHFVLKQLGLAQIQWITQGALLGDDTDSHIDNLVRYCAEDTIAYLACSREDDVHYPALKAMAAQVLALRQPDGRPYRCVPIELPQACFSEAGTRLPASYVNFLIVNEVVLVPVFDCPQDAQALAALGGCFPGRQLLPVPGGNLIRQFGGPHCATMQLPRGSLHPVQ